MNSSSILSTLSRDDQNRISAWRDSLYDTLNYLHIGDYIYQLPEKHHTYQAFGDHSHRVHVPEIARKGLTESALIAFFQVFKSGRQGEGIASNRDLESIRDRMKAYVLKELSWKVQQYDTLYRTLEQKRDQLTAHYDGTAAGVKKINSAFLTMALRGVYLSQGERTDFMSLAAKMHEFVHKVKMNQI